MADRRVESVPLPAEDDSRDPDVVVQQNAGPAAEEGSGEWPSPDAPSTGPSPGPAATEGNRAGTPARPTSGSASPPGETQDARAAGDRGPARSADTDSGSQRRIWPPEGFKDALEDEPIAGGSGSTPQRDEGT